MNTFDVASILLALAALFGYLNYRYLRLPQSIGILAVTLVSSLFVLLLDSLIPVWNIRSVVSGFLLGIDFNETLMHGMLSFLLFAGALHVDINDLFSNRWTIGILASFSVLLSTAVVGVSVYVLFLWLGFSVPLMVCLCFGALISPTDPIAVLGILKELRAPENLAAKIAGESLFNDGFGVVLFSVLLGFAGLGGGHGGNHVSAVAVFFLREVLGGVILGGGLGYVVYRALKKIDHAALELLLTLSLVMFGYTLSFWLHVSGPLAMVVAGLFIGNHGKQFAMSEKSIEHVDSFWSLWDEILNAVLFLLIGLEVFTVHWKGSVLLAVLLVIPVVLLARIIAVSFPVFLLRKRRSFSRGIIPILTWGGLRGGISVALVLSLPPFEGRELLLSCTFGVVVFSILVQGLTVHRVLNYYHVAEGD